MSTTTLNSKRLRTCILVAVVVHALALISFHPTKKAPSWSNELNLTVVSMPLNQQQTTKATDSEQPKSSPLNHLVSSNQTTQLAQTQSKSLTKRTISAEHHNPEDKPYLLRWQEHIETIGNQNYPKIARDNKLNGSLRLMVSINKDGSVNQVTLRKSSGHQELDDAAIKIVQMAAPFEPFPPEIANSVDVLDIIRTWQFRGSFTSKG